MAEASEKQYAFLEQLSGKDFRESELTSAEASKKIEAITGKGKEEKPSDKPSAKKGDMSKDDWAEKDRLERDSIESQVAFKGFVEMIVAGVLEGTSKEFQTALNWANTKLANWASMGEPPKTSKGEPMITDMQVVQLVAMANEKGYDPREVVLIMMEQYEESASKDLTEKEAKKLIGLLGEGYHIKEESQEEVPF